ncbi:hypothetical protein CEUSTIGMA_g4951.t1 [Chlamydomonas eustigma]|uniref:Uncharacterized protein n=1 Tax=Chlamydomonas eustigma TaxID=1157962 RepID=A0A250X358_9CHLO|nr:hypothetical protein CEUSTIGMA_g4951.t1 [Chlamydomonas eustigma]|eukprot:GAX77507.1 hypothetical protein CEUSTIGMA_g4951.t1 [Chlamydomonas eustigma]
MVNNKKSPKKFEASIKETTSVTSHVKKKDVLPKKPPNVKNLNFESTTSLIALALSCFVVLQCPTHMMKAVNEQNRFTTKPVSPLEITAWTGSELLPTATPLFRLMLYPGVMIKQVSQVLTYCYLGNGPCDFTSLTEYNKIWKGTLIKRQDQYDWRTSAGKNFAFLSCSSTVVTVAGLACFFVPVNMVVVGLLLMIAGLYYTKECSVLPNLMFMIFLGFMMLVGDPKPKDTKPGHSSSPLSQSEAAPTQKLEANRKKDTTNKRHLYEI